MDELACMGCGCTEARACDDGGVGCHWVEPGVCSVCARKRDDGARAIAALSNDIVDRINGLPWLTEALVRASMMGGGRLVERLALMLAVGGAAAMEDFRKAYAAATACRHAGPIYGLLGRFELAVGDATTIEEAAARALPAMRWPAAKPAHAHREAFCVMQYIDTEGNVEFIWNSRNGVTPYGVVSRQGHEATHVDWRRDQYAPGHKPRSGDRIFVDLTPERARKKRRAFVERYWDHGTYPVSGAFATKEEAVEHLAKADVDDGHRPDLIEVP